jgi:hypothetical protein
MPRSKKTPKIFYLCKNIDNRELRYYLHKLENLKIIDADRLKKAYESKKPYKISITLSPQEEKIVNKWGKSTNLYVNYVVVDEDEGEPG